MIHKGEHPSASSVMFLLIIDLNPSDMNCVYYTLRYLSTYARRHNVAPIVTFDQPLWLKAVIIQANGALIAMLTSEVFGIPRPVIEQEEYSTTTPYHQSN